MIARTTADLLFVALAVAATLVGYQTLTPAMNTGDYGRIFDAMSLEQAAWTVPANCMPYVNAPAEYPTSSLAVWGYLFSGLNKAMGNSCVSIGHWYLSLSLFYWLGGLFAFRKHHPIARPLKAALLAGLHFLFGGYLYSFYQEAMLIVLAPWLTLLVPADKASGRSLVPLVLLAMASKSQAVFWAPFFLYLVYVVHRAHPSWIRSGLASAVILVTCWSAVFNSCCGMQNAYNRIFNGIGWSMLAAQTWPAPEFDQRHTYFYENEPRLGQVAGSACAPDHLALMGTSYWPTGDAVRNTEPESEFADLNRSFVEGLGFSEYLSCLTSEGSISGYLGTLYAIYWQSDYSVGYAIKQTSDGPVSAAVVDARTSVLTHLPKVLIAVALIMGLVYGGYAALAFSAYVLVLTPLLVVVGDGYFEFEKHMAMNFALLISPVFLMMGNGGGSHLLRRFSRR